MTTITEYTGPMRFAAPGERRVARKLIDAILRRGYVISTHNGEYWSTKQTGDRDSILAELCATEQDTVAFRKPGADTRAGSFFLFWFNDKSGEELIADYTDNDETNAIYREVMGRDDDDWS
jgi:hypothetical protein